MAILKARSNFAHTMHLGGASKNVRVTFKTSRRVRVFQLMQFAVSVNSILKTKLVKVLF